MTVSSLLNVPDEELKSAEGKKYLVTPSQQEISEFQENTVRNFTIYTSEDRLLPWLPFRLIETRVLQSTFAFSSFGLIVCVIGCRNKVQQFVSRSQWKQ